METLALTFLREPHLLFWIVNLCFFIGFIPQIILNYRLKSAAGLSDLMILAYINGHVSFLLYVYCLHLPTAYKVVLPIGAVALGIIVIQRFYYAQWHEIKHLFLVYAINAIFIAFVVYQSFYYPQQIGHIAGWFLFTLAALQQTPQAYKIYRNRSVKGFSFLFVTITTLGNIIQLIAGLALQFPLQSIVGDIRALIMYIIFCIQFWLYSSKD